MKIIKILKTGRTEAMIIKDRKYKESLDELIFIGGFAKGTTVYNVLIERKIPYWNVVKRFNKTVFKSKKGYYFQIKGKRIYFDFENLNLVEAN